MAPPIGGAAAVAATPHIAPTTALELAPRLTLLPAFRAPVPTGPFGVDPGQRFFDRQLAYNVGIDLQRIMGGAAFSDRAWLRFGAHTHYAAYHAPRLGASFGLMEVLAAGAHTAGLENPTAHFSVVVGGTHVLQPAVEWGMDRVYASIHRLLDGPAANTNTIVAETADAAASVAVKTAEFELGQSIKTLAVRAATGTMNLGKAIVQAPFHMGRGLIWSKFWEVAYGYVTDSDRVDAHTGNPTAGFARAALYGFFTEEAINIATRGALTKLLTGNGLVAALGRGLNIAGAIPFAGDLITIAKYGFMGDAGNALMGQNYRIGEARHGGRDLWGILRYAGMGQSIIDDTVAGHSVFTPLADLHDWLGENVTAELWPEQTASYIRDLISRQDGIEVSRLATSFRDVVWKMLITADANSFDTLAAVYRKGFLDRVDPIAFLGTYDKSADGPESFYTLVRAFRMYAQYGVAQTIANLFDEKFLGLMPGNSKLVNGMPVVANGGCGWAALLRYVAGPQGAQAILDQRQISFYKQALAVEIDASAAHATATDDPADAVALGLTNTAHGKWLGLAREIGRVDAHGQLTATGTYYRALGELARDQVLKGDEAALQSVQTWAASRLEQLKRPDLPPDVRTRMITELKVINPYIVFGRTGKAIADFKRIDAVATTGDGAQLRYNPDGTTRHFDHVASTAMRETATFWSTNATYTLYLDVLGQTAHEGGIDRFQVGLPAAANTTFATLQRHQHITELQARIAHLEGIKASDDASSAYDYGKPGCERLPGDGPCDGSRRHVYVDLFNARKELTELTNPATFDPNLAEAVTFFQYAADTRAWSSVEVDLPAGLDQATGLPNDAATVAALALPTLQSTNQHEEELGVMAHKPGWHYPDPSTPYTTAKHTEYVATSKELGRTFGRWYADAITAGKDPQAYIQDRLASRGGLATRRDMQKQIIRLKFAPNLVSTASATDAQVFDEHGNVKNYSMLLHWITNGGPYVYHEVADRLGNALGNLYVGAVAEHQLTDPETMTKALLHQDGIFPTLHAFLETQMNADDKRTVALLVRTLQALEAQPGRHPHTQFFTVDDNGGLHISDVRQLGNWLTMQGRRPWQNAEAPSYVQAALQKWVVTAASLQTTLQAQYDASTTDVERTAIGMQLAKAVSLTARLTTMMTVREARRAQYDQNTATLAAQFVTWWKEVPGFDADARAQRRLHIQTQLNHAVGSREIRELMHEQIALQRDYKLEGKAADKIYYPNGVIIDWDRFEAWIEGTGKTPKPPPPAPVKPAAPELDYARPGFKM